MSAIDTVLAMAPQTAMVQVRGVGITVQALTMAQIEIVREAAGAAPTPPRKPDPARGSLAPPMPDESDPQYIAGRARWSAMMLACEAAACVHAGSHDVEPLTSELVRARGLAIYSRLAEDEVLRIVSAARALSVPASDGDARVGAEDPN